MARVSARRRLFAPEIVQTSAMDCGPAALKCLLEGFGIAASYGRLREACQTNVDGTSIDTIEIARQLGLDAVQVMLPSTTCSWPSPRLCRPWWVRLPNGFTHFVVVWRRHGPLVQLMDPASGQRWLSCASFLRDVSVHELPVSAADWHAWARSDEFLKPLSKRLADLGITDREAFIDAAAGVADWRAIAALDAGTRLVTSLVRARASRPGCPAQRLLRTLLERAENNPLAGAIPERYWSVRPAPPAPDQMDTSAKEALILKGVVLIAMRGPLPTADIAPPHRLADQAATAGHVAAGLAPPGQPAALSPELAAALGESPTRPGREFLRLLHGDGLLSFTVLGGGLALAAGSLILEALLLRSIIDIGRELGL